MALPKLPSPITLSQIHQLVGGTIHGDENTPISLLASLSEATPQALSFIANDKALKLPDGFQAAAVLIHRHVPELTIPQIVVGHPLMAFAMVAQRLYVRPTPPRGIAKEITKGADVTIGADASIWPFVTLGDRVTIGSRVTLMHNMAPLRWAGQGVRQALLADPRVAESLRLIHASPAERWSVEILAGSVALSPSRYAARFRAAMGRSVMSYVAAWRANVACRLLRESTLNLGEIAGHVGYESLPAFSRAFKAQLGQSPTAWRAARRRDAQATPR